MAVRRNRATNSGPISIDATSRKDLQQLMRDLKKISPELAKETRAAFKRAAVPILNDARKRQPKKTGELRRKTKIRFSRGRLEIRSSARHARISEFGGRHPLWGDREHWVAQKPAPALFPAMDAGKPNVLRQVDNAVFVACKKAGFT